MSHLLLTFPPPHFVVCLLESRHANVFYLLPSQLSPGFLTHPLSLCLPISALVCLDLSFRGLMFIQPLHMSKPSQPPLSLRNSAVGYTLPLSRCVHFAHEPVLSFLLPTTVCYEWFCVMYKLTVAIHSIYFIIK